MPDFKTTKESTGEEIDQFSEVCKDLGSIYFLIKESEREKSNLRDEFFKEATKELEGQKLPQKTVNVPEDISDAAAEAFVLKYHSGYRIVEQIDPDTFLIEEDPDLQPYSKVVLAREGDTYDDKPVSGYVISRSIASGGALVDDERLIDLDWDLYYGVTKFANEDLALLTGIDNNQLFEMGWPRVLKSPDELDDEQREAIKQYCYEGPKVVKLLVRQAKPEELDEQ